MFWNEKKTSQYLSVTIIVLIIINIVVTFISMQSVEKMEIMKVGGKENYKKLESIMQSDIYKDQYAKNLELMLQQMQEEGSKPANTIEQNPVEEPIEENAMSGETFVPTNNTGDVSINE